MSPVKARAAARSATGSREVRGAPSPSVIPSPPPSAPGKPTPGGPPRNSGGGPGGGVCFGRGEAPRRGPAGTEAGTVQRILLVEDDDAFRIFCRVALES